MFFLLPTKSKCSLYLNAPSSQSMFDAEVFGYLLMLESVFGSLAVPAAVYLTLNTQLHSLVFASIFMNTCNMTAALRQMAAAGQDSVLDEQCNGRRFLERPTDEYQAFLEQNIGQQKDAAKVRVVKTALDLVDHLQTQKPEAFRALGVVADKAKRIKSRTQLSMADVSQAEQSRLMLSAVDLSVMQENAIEEVEALEEFDGVFKAKQARKEMIRHFMRIADDDYDRSSRKNLLLKALSTGMRLLQGKSKSRGHSPESPNKSPFGEARSFAFRSASKDRDKAESERGLLMDRTPKFSHVFHEADHHNNQSPGELQEGQRTDSQPRQRDPLLRKFAQ